ncbi:hypothetical protein TWF281_006993 [Arthrobotrys megalospora]
MPSSCKELRLAVVECLRASDCIAKQGYSPAECIRMPLKEQLPTQCQQLLHAYGECKLSFITTHDFDFMWQKYSMGTG